MFKPWQLAAIDDAGYNGISDEHIERIVESMIEAGDTKFDRDTFEYHCSKCGIDPGNFTKEDFRRLKEKLDEES